jgi:DNA repair photolyase
MMISGAWYITSFSEPFYPKLEEHYHVVRRLSEVLIREGLPFFYLSKQAPHPYAYAYLQENPYSYMQFSISTGNGDHWRKLAPGAPDLYEMYDNIWRMNRQGIYVSIQCNPIVPGVTSLDDIIGLCRKVADAGAQHIIFKFVEQVANNRRTIIDRMHERKLPGVDAFDAIFNQVIGGVYTVQEDVRIEWLDELLKVTREVGLTMSLCYEYFDNGHAGGNLAPFYTTSDQCHGRGVPMYFRPEKGAPW